MTLAPDEQSNSEALSGPTGQRSAAGPTATANSNTPHKKASKTRPLPPSGTVLTRLVAGPEPIYVDAAAWALVRAGLRRGYVYFFCCGPVGTHEKK